MEEHRDDTQPSTNPTQEVQNTPQNQAELCRLVCTTHDFGGQVILNHEKVGKQEWKFGRDKQCDVWLGHSKRISKVHFVIWVNGKDDTVLIKDVSTNGTMLNRIKLTKNQGYILAQGDEITAGMGVTEDIITFVVFLPRRPRSTPEEGIHALYDLRSGVLGQGAFAVVKRAVERATGDHYAVKIIDKKKVMSGMAVQREIDILKKIQHNNIVSLKAFFEDSRSYYLVMDLVEGGDLMDFVTNNGPIPEDATREIARQVFTAVAYMHSISISHRDIKPDNILIAQDEPVIVKVSDFGLAKIAKSGTHLQTFCGTLAYLAPEVLARKHDNTKSIVYSDKVDIWSIGCMLYVLLTGYLPFPQNTQHALYRSILAGDFSTETLKEHVVSDEGINFIKTILQVDPNIRPSAADALKLPWLLEGSEQADDEPESELEEPTTAAPLARSMSQLGMKDEQPSGGAVGNENGDGSNKAPDNIDDVPSTALIDNGPKSSMINASAPPLDEDRMEDDGEESDKDGEDIENVIKAQCSQRVNEVNSSIMQSMIQNSSPIQGAPFISVVRDLEIDSQNTDFPLGTWMIFQTLGESIPHRDIYFTQPKITFGRVPSSAVDVAINESRMSKNHCVIFQEEGNQDDSQEFCRVWLADTSTNGCYINDKQIRSGNRAMLQDGDKIYMFWDPKANKLLGFTVHFIDNQAFSRRPTQEVIIEPTKFIPGNEALAAIPEAPESYEAIQPENSGKRAFRVRNFLLFFFIKMMSNINIHLGFTN